MGVKNSYRGPREENGYLEKSCHSIYCPISVFSQSLWDLSLKLAPLEFMCMHSGEKSVTEMVCESPGPFVL